MERNEESKEINKKSVVIKNICLAGIFLALLCVLSPFSIPLGPVPITLATFFIYLIAAILDTKISCTIVALYLLLGSFGLPVFSSFQGGFQVILGPTGGFLIGYLPCTFIISFFLKLMNKRKWAYPFLMICGTLILYTIGTIWFMVYSNSSLLKSLYTCVIPFLIGDLFKIIIASFISIYLNAILKKEK